MTDLWSYFKSLFKQAEASSSAKPYIHELIERSEDELADFEYWKGTLVARRLLDWLSDKYAIHRVMPDKTDRAMSFLDTASSNGFAIHFGLTQYSRRDVTFLMDWLKEKVQALNYRIQISDRRIYRSGTIMETVEKHYLKPRADFTSKEKFNQGYGNITISIVLHDEKVQHLKLIATRYSDHLYKDANDFKQLMQVILQ